MRKFKILGVFVAVLAFSALAVASAGATQWLSGGEPITKAISAPSHGTIILVHEKGSLGKAKIRCSGLFLGTVGPGAEDSITLAESLTGEKDLIGNCETIEGFCFGAVIHPVGLPWDTKLLLVGSPVKTVDDILNAGYIVLCSFGVQVECTGTSQTEFKGNDSDGALFAQLGKAGGIQACSDGGEGWVESTANGLSLGVTVS
jgi:hypothetical protein